MKVSKTENERFYREGIQAVIAAEKAHEELFSTHKGAFDRFFDLTSAHDENYVQENFPELKKSVDLIYESSANLQKLKSDPFALRTALMKSLAAEMTAICFQGRMRGDPITKLREDLTKLSVFRKNFLDGIEVDFWFGNAHRVTPFRSRHSISGPAVRAWCKKRNILLGTLDDALIILVPLWDKYTPKPDKNISTILSKLDEYPFDIDELLENARAWPEANLEVVEGVIAARSLALTMRTS